ncbi:MAG: helicase C-terminal domain-containing protein [archaeon]
MLGDLQERIEELLQEVQTYDATREQWSKLRDLQAEIKASTTLTSQEKNVARRKLSEGGFEVLKSKSGKNLEELTEKAGDLEARLQDCAEEEVGTMFKSYQALQSDVNTYLLPPEGVPKVREAIQNLFTLWTEKKVEFDEINEEKRQELLKTLFSDQDIPEVEPRDRARPMQVPSIVSDVDLEGLMDIYENIFNFGEGSERTNEFRQEQVQYMLMCHEAVQTGGDVVIEGPTGLGKTRAIIAAIMPSLIANPDRRVIYTTRTITQVVSVTDDLQKMLQDGTFEGITASLFIGKNNLKDDDGTIKCYVKGSKFYDENKKRARKDPPEPPLTPEHCNFGCATHEPHRFPSNSDEPTAGHKFHYNEHSVIGLKELDDNLDLCPARIFESATHGARIVVVPHNYVYDSYWRKKYFGDSEDMVLVVDEAHNFLADAGSNPYLVLGRNVPEKEDKDSEIDDTENGDADNGASKKRRAMPESRQSNIYYLEDMVREVDRKLSSFLDVDFDIHGKSLRDIFGYVLSVYAEVAIAVKDHLTEETEIPSAEDAPNRYLVAENTLFSMVSDMPEDFLPKLKSLDAMLAEAKDELETVSEEMQRKIEASLYSYHQIVESLLEIFENPYEFLLLVDGDDFKFYNLHPSKQADQSIQGFHSRIFTSATLSPPEEVAYLLGTPNALHAKIDPIFDDKNYKPFFIVGMNSGSKEELRETGEYATEKEKQVLTDMFSHALSAAEGRNIGVFCNSNRMVMGVYDLLRGLDLDFMLLTYYGKNPASVPPEMMKKAEADFREIYHARIEALKQGENVPEECRDVRLSYTAPNIINSFKLLGYDPNQTAILLGAQGASLSEGIDYYRKQMEMVITVGLPYPSSATETRINKIKENYFFMQRGNRQLGIDLAFRLDAFRKLAQSIGRSHRRMDDRGVIICADERLVGVKNVKNDGSDRYAYLSLQNAAKNIGVLQRPMSIINGNVILGGYDTREELGLARYISSRLCFMEDFISFGKMAEEIVEFYKEGI